MPRIHFSQFASRYDFLDPDFPSLACLFLFRPGSVESPKHERLGEMMKEIGRNSPCPCGSGKKYKQCCLKKPSSRLRYVDECANALSVAHHWLSQYHEDEIQECLGNFLALVPNRPQIPKAVEQLVAGNGHEWAIIEGRNVGRSGRIPLIDKVLGYGGPELTPIQRRFLEQVRRSPLNLYKVLGTRGTEVQLQELFPTDEKEGLATRSVHAPSLVQGPLSEPGQVLGLRLIPGDPWLPTKALYFFPASWAPNIVDVMHQYRATWSKPQDRLVSFSVPLIIEWMRIVDERPPDLRDEKTGNPILFVTHTYEIQDDPALVQRMEAQDDVIAKDNGWMWVEDTGEGRRSLKATLYRDEEHADRLFMFSRTEELGDLCESWLQDVAGDVLTHIGREVGSPNALLESMKEEGGVLHPESDEASTEPK